MLPRREIREDDERGTAVPGYCPVRESKKKRRWSERKKDGGPKGESPPGARHKSLWTDSMFD